MTCWCRWYTTNSGAGLVSRGQSGSVWVLVECPRFSVSKQTSPSDATTNCEAAFCTVPLILFASVLCIRQTVNSCTDLDPANSSPPPLDPNTSNSTHYLPTKTATSTHYSNGDIMADSVSHKEALNLCITNS